MWGSVCALAACVCVCRYTETERKKQRKKERERERDMCVLRSSNKLAFGACGSGTTISAVWALATMFTSHRSVIMAAGCRA